MKEATEFEWPKEIGEAKEVSVEFDLDKPFSEQMAPTDVVAEVLKDTDPLLGECLGKLAALKQESLGWRETYLRVVMSVLVLAANEIPLTGFAYTLDLEERMVRFIVRPTKSTKLVITTRVREDGALTTVALQNATFDQFAAIIEGLKTKGET